MVQTLIDALLGGQNPDGGWGAAAGRPSNTEATSWTLVGMSAWKDRVPADCLDRGMTWLARRQRSDGSWPFADQFSEPSWSTALAVLAADALEPSGRVALRGAEWLLDQKGRTGGWIASLMYRFAPDALPVRLNPDLQGWSWVPATSSWVEPTAYALISLQKLRANLTDPVAEERIREGQALLYDRMCPGGGWNYGNTWVLGEELWAYPEITALALIALQSDRTSEPNQRSLKALGTMLGEFGSGLALSWTILCLTVYGQETRMWRSRLEEQYARAGFLGETKALALSLLASGGESQILRIFGND